MSVKSCMFIILLRLFLLLFFHDESASSFLMTPAGAPSDENVKIEYKKVASALTPSDGFSWIHSCIQKRCGHTKSYVDLQDCARENCRSSRENREHAWTTGPLFSCGPHCQAMTPSTSTDDIDSGHDQHDDSKSLSVSCLSLCWRLTERKGRQYFRPCIVRFCHQILSKSALEWQPNGKAGADSEPKDYDDFGWNEEQNGELFTAHETNSMPAEQTDSVEATDRRLLWKRFGQRLCVEAYCQGREGYHLVACGMSLCHGD